MPDTKQRNSEERARTHPIRAKILALYAEDEDRSLAAEDILADLTEDDTNISAVAYHVRILKDAGLLPKEKQPQG
jgi:DNA-binding transcriptional ArsR family regulator